MTCLSPALAALYAELVPIGISYSPVTPSGGGACEGEGELEW